VQLFAPNASNWRSRAKTKRARPKKKSLLPSGRCWPEVRSDPDQEQWQYTPDKDA
jgi:hypothetical protein